MSNRGDAACIIARAVALKLVQLYDVFTDSGAMCRLADKGRWWASAALITHFFCAKNQLTRWELVMRRTLLALVFVILPQIASAQNPISSIAARPDGNTEQSLSVPVTNADGTTSMQTTYIIRQPDGSSVELDKQGHITKVSLKENCSEGQSRVTNGTYVCRLYKGQLVQFKVLYLAYSCHAPDSNIFDIQRRFAISFQNTGVPCNETSYAVDRADAARYGENLPEYQPKAAEKPAQPEHTTGGGSSENNGKHPRKAERKSTKRHRAARRESQPSETAHSTSAPGIELSIGLGGGRHGGFEKHESGAHSRKTD